MSARIDRESLLVEVEGDTTLQALEATLAMAGLTLDVEGAASSRATVASWLAAGAPGARDPWLDPVDHLVAGLDVTTSSGASVSLRPGPRRSTGPDLMTLFVGAGTRFGRIEKAHLRVHRIGVARARIGPVGFDVDPEPGREERALLERVEAALSSLPGELAQASRIGKEPM